MVFCQLPNGVKEAEDLEPLMPNVRLLKQAQATKAAVRQLHNPSVLHLATHGFFLEGPKRDRPDAPLMDNPLARSVLALANANQRQQCKDSDHDCNGILTAQEVTTMDLRGTKLVFLSACETGLGCQWCRSL